MTTSFVGRKRELALLRDGVGACAQPDAASWSRSSVTQALASQGSPPNSWHRWSAGRAGAVSPTGRGSLLARCGSGEATRLLPPEEPPPRRSAPCWGRARRDTAEEIAWAFRKTLEHAAAAHPRGRVRRHPVGRGDVPRPDRAHCPAVPAPRSSWSASRGPNSPNATDLAGDVSARAARRGRRRRADPARARRSCARRLLAPPGATHSSSSRCSSWLARSGTRSSSHLRCKRYSPRGSINSNLPSGACSSTARSKERSSIAARFGHSGGLRKV